MGSSTSATSSATRAEVAPAASSAHVAAVLAGLTAAGFSCHAATERHGTLQGWPTADVSVELDGNALAAFHTVLAAIAVAHDGVVFGISEPAVAVRRFAIALPNETGAPDLITAEASIVSGSPPVPDPGRSGGFQVAVLGPDGVGKSTVCDGVARALRHAFSGVELIYMRPGLLPGRTVPGGPDGTTGPHDIPPYGVLPSVLKLCYLLADYVLGHWLLVHPKLKAGRLVVSDRYCLDIVADPLRYRYGGPMSLARVAARVVPGLDLHIVLSASVEVIQNRRDEMTHQETEQQSAGYRAVAKEYPNVVVVDAGGPSDGVVRDAAWAVVRAMARRLEDG